MAEYGDSGVSELEELYRRAAGSRRSFEPDMYLNLAYFSGYQWCNFSAGRLNRPAIDPRRDLVTDNRIMPVVGHFTARKVKNKPQFVTTPFSADDADVEAASIGEKILEGDWDYLDLQQKLFDANLWADVAGDGFWKVYWDSTIGDQEDFVIGPGGKPLVHPVDQTPLRAGEVGPLLDQADPNTGMPLMPPELLADATTKTLAIGDVCVEVITPFEVFPDPLATSMEDLEWIIEEKVRSVNYLKQRYPQTADGKEFVPTPDADVRGGITESRLGGPAWLDTEARYKGVKLYEYWCRPNVEHPKGKRCVWANSTLLVEEEPFDPMPYVRFASVSVPGRFWSKGITSFLRGPQTSLNKLLTQIEENAKRIGNPALMASREASVEYEGVPGERISFSSTVPDAVPQYLIPPPVPAYMENQIERIFQSINEISGIHEVSKAQVPTGVTAASAINLLQEQDDTRIGPQIQAMERALEKAGSKILKLRAEFNTDERTIRLVGEDGDWDIFAFKGAMLGKDPQVQVQAGSAMPRSKAAKQAAMFQLLELAFQYIPEALDPRNMRKFFKDFEVGSLDRLFENVSNDEAQCVREHRELYQGNQVVITPIDNDQFHISAHEDEAKSSRFASQPPDVQENFYGHIDQHRLRLKHITDMQLAAAQQGPEPPSESMSYKDAPPDIQRQMEEAAGFEPSQDGITVDQRLQTADKAGEPPPPKPNENGNNAGSKPEAKRLSPRASK